MEASKKERDTENSTPNLNLDSVRNQLQDNTLSNVIDKEFGKSDSFPFDIFPNAIQELIRDAENSIGYNSEFLATGILSFSATAIGTSVNLYNGSYSAIPILWLAIVGRSGIGKTHPLSYAKKPLDKKDEKSYIEYKEQYKNYELQECKGSKPNYVKSILSDFTIEKLAETLQFNEKGVVIFRDELIGWINSFGQYKSGDDQQKYIELFNGAPLTKDRVSNPPIRVKNPNVNILGGLQPKVLKKMASNDRNEDGFLARFLFVYPKVLKPNLFTGKNIKEHNTDNYNRFFNNLYDIPNMTLIANERQIQIYQDWQHKTAVKYFNEELEQLIQSKLETYVWRFALIIEIMQQASINNFNIKLSDKSIVKAIKLTEYFRENTLKVYDKIFSNNPLEDLPNNKINLLNDLPNNDFKRGDVLSLFKKNGINGGTIDRFLGNKKYFTCVSRGVYRKKTT